MCQLKAISPIKGLNQTIKLLKRFHTKALMLIFITATYSCNTTKFVHDYPEWDFYDNKTEKSSTRIEQFPKDASDWTYFKAPYRKTRVSAWIGEVSDTLFFQKLDSLVKLHPDYNNQVRFVNLWISNSKPRKDELIDKNNCFINIQLLTPYYPDVYDNDGVIVPFNGINYILFPSIPDDLITIRGLTHIKTFPILMLPPLDPTIVYVKNNEFRILKKKDDEYKLYLDT